MSARSLSTKMVSPDGLRCLPCVRHAGRDVVCHGLELNGDEVVSAASCSDCASLQCVHCARGTVSSPAARFAKGWRPTRTDEASHDHAAVLRCPNPDACPPTAEPRACADGFTGLLCALCTEAVGGHRWYRRGLGREPHTGYGVSGNCRTIEFETVSTDVRMHTRAQTYSIILL